MHVSRGLSYTVLSALLSGLVSAARPAFADTYTLYTVEHTSSESFSAGDDLGDFVINATGSTLHPCGVSAQSCYRVGSVATGSTGYTTAEPTLGQGTVTKTQTPAHPVLGPAWQVSGQMGGIFAATYAAGDLNLRGLFDGTDPVRDYLGTGSIDGGLVSQGGSVYFTNGLSNTLVVALDTSIAPAPEPGTLALLGTGCSGLGILLGRRRIVRSAR